MKKRVREDRTMINGVTFNSQLERKIRISARRRRGIRLVQYLLHKKEPRERGEERMIQKGNPSWLTAGKTNLPATAARTKPASPIFKKERKFWRKKEGIGVRSRGRTLKLKRYR